MATIKSVFSPSQSAIYPASFYEVHKRVGTWPEDGIEISDGDAIRFNCSNEPEGKMRGMVDGALCWVDSPTKVLSKELLIRNAEQFKLALRSTADTEIVWRQDAVDAGIATAEEAAACWLNGKNTGFC